MTEHDRTLKLLLDLTATLVKYLGFVWVCSHNAGRHRRPKDIAGLPTRWIQAWTRLSRTRVLKNATFFSSCKAVVKNFVLD